MTITRRELIAASAGLVAYLPALTEAHAQTAPAPAPKQTEQELLKDLVAANHFLSDKEVIDGYGHVSARDPNNPNHYHMLRDLAPALATAADILTYDLESNPLNAPGVAIVNERFIHGEIYKARPDVMAVVHSHAAELIPFGVTGIQLLPISHMGAFIGAGIPTFEIRPYREANDKSMLVHTPALGKALAQELGNHPAILMRGHGGAVVGNTLGQAVARALYLQRNATVQRETMAMGAKINYMDADEAKAMGDNSYYRDWDAWKLWGPAESAGGAK